MQKSKCTHIRIRDDIGYDFNVEQFIKSLENKYNIDFRSLPRWEDLIRRLHISQYKCKRKIQHANQQKEAIINKLYSQWNRPSPFQLTTELARTAKIWRQRKIERKFSRLSEEIEVQYIEDTTEQLTEKQRNDLVTPHPNSDVSFEVHQNIPSKVINAYKDNDDELPLFITTNPHKLISSLGSDDGQLSYHSILNQAQSDTDRVTKWPPTSSVTCKPSTLDIECSTMRPRSLVFSLTNHSGVYLDVRFHQITEPTPFLKAKILPVIPKRLYPGIAVVFKFIFKLKTQEPFESGLYFKIGRDGYNAAPTESLVIPIITYNVERIVRIPESVTIAPVYLWQVKMAQSWSFPSGYLKISVEDYTGHLHICKRELDFSTEDEIQYSIRTASSTEARQVSEDETFNTSKINNCVKSKQTSQSKLTVSTVVNSELEQSKADEGMVFQIIEDIIQLALDIFVFDSTYKYLQPNSKVIIPIYFTKATHIGCHQKYYDLKLYDPETETEVMNKSLKVFADVLPNPIQITPIILDMSKSPEHHGYRQDQFIVTNNHKVFSATINIKLTTKMKKLFCVVPMKCVVPSQSSVSFQIQCCSRDKFSPKPYEDLVHFTFKIIIVGNKSVYENVPPIFYEVICPCAYEFKKVYNEKYFKEET